MGFLWSYNRTVHLLLLILLIGLFLTAWAFIFFTFRELQFQGLLWLIAAAIFLVFWLLRGLKLTAPLFPWFHYGTIIVEWVAHVVKFVIQMYFLVVNLSTPGFFSAPSIVFVINLVVLLIDLTYFLLIFTYALLRSWPQKLFGGTK